MIDLTAADSDIRKCLEKAVVAYDRFADRPTVPATHYYCAQVMSSGNPEYHVFNADGSAMRFTGPAPSPIADRGTNASLRQQVHSDGTVVWLVLQADGFIDRFSVSGVLLDRTRITGQKLTYGYSDANTAPNVAPRPGFVTAIEDSFGRRLELTYNARGSVTSAKIPGGADIRYLYGESSANCSGSGVCDALTSVVFEDGSRHVYHYNESDHINGGTACAGSAGGEFPTSLTGISDELSIRYSDFYYNCQGQGIRTEHAEGAGRYDLNYISSSVVDVIDPLGSVRRMTFYKYANATRLSLQSQPAGSGCAASSSSLGYDTAGNVTRKDDFKGNRSCHKYDLTRNLETARIEGLASATACPTDAATYVIPANLAADKPQIKVSTAWHPDWRLEIKRAEPKKLTTWVYNGQPDPSAGGAIASCAPGDALLPDGKPIAVLCKKIEQSTGDASGTQGFAAAVSGPARTWVWTYNRHGQMLSEDGPRTDVSDSTTYTYYADTSFDAAGVGHTLGDLWTVTNAKGQVTEITQYDKHGHPLEIIDPNGLVTRLTYHVRGWLTARSVGPAGGPRQQTDYEYDAAGQLKQVTNPDGSHLAYTYDAAHRLTDVTDSLGNRIHYTLDAMGNRTREEVKDPDGTLVRSQRRVHDALGRVQNLITPAQ